MGRTPLQCSGKRRLDCNCLQGDCIDGIMFAAEVNAWLQTVCSTTKQIKGRRQRGTEMDSIKSFYTRESECLTSVQSAYFACLRADTTSERSPVLTFWMSIPLATFLMSIFLRSIFLKSNLGDGAAALKESVGRVIGRGQELFVVKIYFYYFSSFGLL